MHSKKGWIVYSGVNANTVSDDADLLSRTFVVLALASEVLRAAKRSIGDIALPQCNVSFAQLGFFCLQV